MLGTANTLKLKPLLDELQDTRATNERQELDQNIGRQFVKERHGKRTKVRLLEVGKRDVKVVEGDRKDSYRLSLQEFIKFYKLVP